MKGIWKGGEYKGWGREKGKGKGGDGTEKGRMEVKGTGLRCVRGGSANGDLEQKEVKRGCGREGSIKDEEGRKVGEREGMGWWKEEGRLWGVRGGGVVWHAIN
jgi:hypothetical protein